MLFTQRIGLPAASRLRATAATQGIVLRTFGPCIVQGQGTRARPMAHIRFHYAEDDDVSRLWARSESMDGEEEEADVVKLEVNCS